MTPEMEPGRRRRQSLGGGKGEDDAKTQETAGAMAGSMSWLNDGHGDQRAAAAGASRKSGVRWKENWEREAPVMVP